MFYISGVNFKNLGFGKLKHFFITDSKITELYKNIKNRFNSIKELFILSTCNRTEIYYIGDEQLDFSTLLNTNSNIPAYLYCGDNALIHFLKVMCGLDSQIIGETQITGQMKNSINSAIELGFAGNVLKKMLDFGISINKYIRNNTNIGNGHLSYGKIVVDIVKKNFSNLSTLKAMIIGTGKLSENICKNLSAKGIFVYIVSHKHFKRAFEFAERYNGTALEYNAMRSKLQSNDIIITATSSPHIILKKEDFHNIKSGTIVIDLTLQRNVDDNVIQTAKLYTLSDINMIVKNVKKIKLFEKKKALDIIKNIVLNYDKIYLYYNNNSLMVNI